MRRSPPSFRLFAAAAVPSSSVTAAASFVSMRPTSREGSGNQWRTGVSSMPTTTTMMEQRFLLQQQSGNAKQGWFRPRPQSRHLYNCNYNHSRPSSSSSSSSSSYPRHNNIPDPPNPNNQNDKFRSRPSDYRIWEYATALHSRSERFMILSYNLLADYLAINHRTKLYFHIPPKFLDWNWRKGSLLFELGLWSPDIMCFQEVDRFGDLEEELKLRGYCGIWKMRTGDAVDGCAIFWRASRFRLLYEEWFEFNKLGLRDNVAQICVLELVCDKNNAKTSTLPQRLTASNKVVICNIHVLYNPRRGEMKLGQVRVLLNRAHAVSKIWNGAPVVLCGDFNCTPKSPLYNYIAEQKLDLTEVDRDKVSGQASAEIRSPRSYSQNPRIQSIDKSSLATTMADDREIGMEQGPHYLNMQKQNYSDSIVGDVSFQNAISQFSSGKAGPDVSNDSFFDGHFGDERMTLCEEVTKKTQLDTTNAGVDQTDPIDHVTVDKLKESQSELKNDGGFPVGAMTNGSDDNTAPAHPCFQTVVFPPNDNKICDEAAISSVGYEDTTVRTGSVLRNISNSDSSSELFHESDERGNELASCQFSPAAANVELDNSDSTKADENSDVHTAVLDYFPRMDSVPDDVERTAYDPSKWTPMDLETATGNADCPLVEHPLKLKSTYTETEDRSGARDSNREPLVTSYNRRFSGTVDYIWRSEGLQTVRVLAPMRKDAMQWTRGFPTKKWGSDHIALVSELAFSEVTENKCD